jgi:MOSC domain-containing protein YiiM
MRYDLAAICAGTSQIIRDDGAQSAIIKSVVEGPVSISFLGVGGDMQADLTVHGGPDKALHLYSSDHYRHWANVLGQHDALQKPGAFGENLCVAGLVETDIWLGDQFRLGGALIEVSMGRQPCWKLDARFGVKGVMAHMVQSGRCGAYFRVIEEGVARADDGLIRERRGDADWPVSRLFAGLISGQAKLNQADLAALAHNPLLGKSWQERAQKMTLIV